jgi:hypothetical protein
MENKFTKFLYNFWQKIDKDDVLTEVEQLAFDIFEICLEDDRNARLLAPNTFSKRYIITKSYILDKKSINTFIVLNVTLSNIVIVNHQYRYDISLPTKTCEKMRKMFDNKVEQEREKMEHEILDNITDSLEIVLKKFKDKIK